MLIRFAVENFLSFKEMTEFSMMAGKITRHGNHLLHCNGKRVLKGAFVFGANASGKTNLIRVVGFVRDIIMRGLENVNCDKKWFRIDPAYKEKPGVFQFDIFSGGHFYSYGFALSYSKVAIEEEWLYRIDDNDEFCIFLRSKNDDSEFQFMSDIRFDEKEQQDRFNVYASDISSPKMRNTLFLSDVIMRSPDDRSEYQAFRDVMDWFQRLVIIFPEMTYSRRTELLDKSNEKTRLENLLNHFDTGILSVSKKEIEFDKAFAFFPEEVLDGIKVDLGKNLTEESVGVFVQHDSSLVEIRKKDGKLLAYEVVSNHGNPDDLFEYNDESDGTQRLFDLIPVYQKALEGCVILVDELDRSLHTKAAQEFIDYFYKLSDGVATQLIVTTHDSNIMDLDFVRQDEIWFIERQNNHGSKLYSLNKFKARFDKKVEKDYLLGRYGAIPIFRQSSLNSETMRAGEQDDKTE